MKKWVVLLFVGFFTVLLPYFVAGFGIIVFDNTSFYNFIHHNELGEKLETLTLITGFVMFLVGCFGMIYRRVKSRKSGPYCNK